jgi:hypothetical protein
MPPTPAELRTQLLDLIRHDLLGPANGPDEFVTEASVRERYVLGVLAPTSSATDADADQSADPIGDPTDLDATPDASDEDGPADPVPAKTQGMAATSIGLTFTVDGSATALQITAGWGRYARRDHPDPEQLTSKGARRWVWQRTQQRAVSPPIPLVVGALPDWSPAPEFPDVTVRGMVRRRHDEWSVTLYLTNRQRKPKGRTTDGADSYWIFQPELEVAAPDGAPIFCKHLRLRDTARRDPEELAMQMAYRHEVEFGVGHGVAVQADLAPGMGGRAVRLSTKVIPTYEVGRTTPPTLDDLPALADVVLDMQALADIPDTDFASALTPLTAAYAAWIDAQATQLAGPDLAAYTTAPQETIAAMRVTLARIQAGIDLLGQDAQAAAAFRFANRAMAQQRVHTLYAQRRRQGGEPTLAEFDRPENRRWYPFQLAFVLLNLPALTQLDHPERSDPAAAIADLLWFPTGGGKTEAYLGLTAYTMAIRRLQGIVAGHSGLAGVAVLMRYTLRLLTLQQFQRAAALICACEAIRQEAQAAGDTQWGAEPFRIGLWVGSASTPNTTADSAEALNRTGDGRGTPYQITACPWCGSPIRPDRHLRVDPYAKGRGRTFTWCGDPLGECRFSQRQSPHEGLPVVVVDEEVYRLLPSLLIATVDKFAQLPWKGETQMLFGRVTHHCARHGYCGPELTCGGSHHATYDLPATVTQPIAPLRPPDLIIQDELHLISGPLGTLVGLYETAIDRLCEWQVDGHTVRPKLVASTATIRRAAEQVHQLYLRRVNIFPPAGLDVRDNFFARQRAPTEDEPGRLYVGICAPGLRIKSTLIRAYVAIMAAAQKLYVEHGAAADPYMTTVGYFNAVRELGGMRRAVDDAVTTRLRHTDERGLATRLLKHDGVEELTSRKRAADIPQILDRLEIPFGAATKKAIPLDVLLATNMISVGVDISRLGLMVVAGQPKTTAEYIQATSRVGRRHPGLVLVVYNWARPRDLSHYERFSHYHATFYQHVEPLSVTPFSPRAIDRGLTGVFIALVRQAAATYNDNLGAGRIHRDDPIVADAMQALVHRAAMISGSTAVEQRVQNEVKERLDLWLGRIQQVGGGARLGYKPAKDGVTVGLLESAESNRWGKFVCLNSLRDVETTSSLILDDTNMQPHGVYLMPGVLEATPATAEAGDGAAQTAHAETTIDEAANP